MNNGIRIRPARNAELPTLARLIENQLPDMMAGKKRPANIEEHLASLVPDRSLVLATRGNRLAGLTAIDLDHARILACYLDPETASPETPRELFKAIEQLALSFGIRKLECQVKKQVSGFIRALGYEPEPDDGDNKTPIMTKSLLDEADPELIALIKLQDELGIPADYGVRHRMQLQTEAKTLVPVGRDIFNRDQRLVPAAATAWTRLQTAAAGHSIELKLVSAFRGVTYQANLFRRKLEEGQSMERILTVSAPPGFSEHHSGQAIDVTTTGIKPLEPEFGETKAYRWLRSNAGIYGFRETYPRDNRHGIDWEPWHWRYHHRPGL
jgi:LAS superfamily LD-carboxypeptidase LdcB